MGLVKAKLVVKGEVQKVGYRDFVQQVARALGVKGFVENLRDGTVQVICEIEEEILKDFVKRIQVKEDFMDVESVKVVETGPATGEFKYFDIKFGRLEEELGDRMVMAVNFAKATRKEIGEMRIDVEDVHCEIKDLRSDIGGLRTDVKGMRSDIVDMRSDIGGLRTDVKGMHSEIRDMRSDMNRNFEEMAKRYDAISSELIKTRKELTRAVDNMAKLIDEFIKARKNGGD